MVPSTSIMDKRKDRDEAATSPIDDYNKRRKVEYLYADHDSNVVGETELASAFALASLASLSPHSTNHEPAPEARDVEHQDEDENEEESTGSLEERSPQDEPCPVTPDVRSPIRRTNSINKRVTFDPNTVDHQRLYGRRFSVPPHVQGSRMPPGFRRVVNPHRHHATHAPAPWTRHRVMVPQTHQAPQAPQGFIPPSALPPSPSNQWICDFCNIASFATYHEACSHEETCSLRCHIPPRRPPAMWHQVPNHMVPMQSALMPPAHAESAAPCDPPPASLPSASSREWFQGATFLAFPESDGEWLSELNCFIRLTCVEAFSATEEQVSRTSKRGRITLHQVGIRCAFCTHRKSEEKTVAAVSFPTSVAGIYESVKRWQRVHMDTCEDIPGDIRERLAGLATSNVWIPTTRQYWADSAKALGMVDTEDGIRFAVNPRQNEAPPEGMVEVMNSTPDMAESQPTVTSSGSTLSEGKAIVYSEDLNLVPPYVFFLMSQVESCLFTEADRFVARSKGPVGYPGFQCRHCNGHAGLGKYFPVSSKSLATNSTSQNIHAHLLKCRKCPPELKRKLVALKEEKSKSPRLEPGWRKVFFDKVWGRMHGSSP